MQTDTICLGLLSTGPKSGYEIKQIFEGPLSEIYSLSYGTIYPTLNKLMDEKFVTCKQHAQDKKPDKKVYTIIHNKDHYNVAKLFFENDRRRPEMDSLDILEGVATSYVNFIFDLKKSQVNDFVDNFKKSIDKQDYMSLYKKYGMLRTNPRFWDVYSYLSLKSYRAESNEKGFLDLNRYLKDNI